MKGDNNCNKNNNVVEAEQSENKLVSSESTWNVLKAQVKILIYVSEVKIPIHVKKNDVFLKAAFATHY